MKVLAGLILVNCSRAGERTANYFRPDSTRSGTSQSTPPPPPSPARAARPFDSVGTRGCGEVESGSGVGSTSCSTIPQALEAVIAHRVLPLFVRTLLSWAAIPVTTGSPNPLSARPYHPNSRPPYGHERQYPNSTNTCNGYSSTNASHSTVDTRPASAYAGALSRAIKVTIERESKQRQREAVASGVVDALVAWLLRARQAAQADLDTGARKPSLPTVSWHPSTTGDTRAATGVLRHPVAPPICRPTAAENHSAEAAALDALAALCSSCEEARHKIVVSSFHAAVHYWLRGDLFGSGGGRDRRGGDGGTGGRNGDRSCVDTLCAALLLVRNVARSIVGSNALVGVGVHQCIIRHLESLCEKEGKKEDAEARKATSLVVRALANLCTEHGVVKEALASSECLRWICESAVNEEADVQVRVHPVTCALVCFRRT